MAVTAKHCSTLLPCVGLWAIADPQGNLNHTTVAAIAEESVNKFMSQERILAHMLRGTPCPSWEGYEAEGYRVVGVTLVPA